MTSNPGFVPFTLVSINPNGSFTTKLEEPQEPSAELVAERDGEAVALAHMAGGRSCDHGAPWEPWDA